VAAPKLRPSSLETLSLSLTQCELATESRRSIKRKKSGLIAGVIVYICPNRIFFQAATFRRRFFQNHFPENDFPFLFLPKSTKRPKFHQAEGHFDGQSCAKQMDEPQKWPPKERQKKGENSNCLLVSPFLTDSFLAASWRRIELRIGRQAEDWEQPKSSLRAADPKLQRETQKGKKKQRKSGKLRAKTATVAHWCKLFVCTSQ